MGGSEAEKGIQDRPKKIDDSQGMCGSESGYDSCWSRVCSSDRNNVMRDVLRGLLVIIALAIVITVVFLLCYFLLNDIEKKEEEIVDSLIKDFSSGGSPLHGDPDLSTNPGNSIVPDDTEVYDAGGIAPPGDLGNVGAKLQRAGFETRVIEELGTPHGQEPGLADSSPALDPSAQDAGNLGENVAVVTPPLSQPEPASPQPAAEESQPDSPLLNPIDSFFPVGNPVGSNPVNEIESGPGVPLMTDDEFHDIAYDIEITDLADSNSGPECDSLRLPICSGSMPWSMTAFPNLVNNNNQNELQESLKYFQSIIVGSQCSNRGTEYTCAILEPACGPDAVPLPPCRKFCEDIVRTCSEYIVDGNVHNIAFECGRFPDSQNPNVCVDISRAATPDSAAQPIPNDMTNQQDDHSDQPQNPLLTAQTEDVLGMSDDINKEPSDSSSVPDNPELVNTEEPSKSSSDETLANGEMNTEPSVDVSDTATEPSTYICDHTMFLCVDGSDCLSGESVCDGVQHCLDNSDESNCTKPDCSDDEFSCATTKYCVPQTWLCDGADDCRDNSDEMNCPEKTNSDAFDETNGGENLVAEASNINPGLFSVIAENTEDGGLKLPSANDHIGGLHEESINKHNLDNSQFLPDSDVPDEILAGFSKFGGDSDRNFGTDNIEEVLKSKTESQHQNEDAEEKLSGENLDPLANLSNAENSDRVIGSTPGNNNLRRRRPVRPGLILASRPKTPAPASNTDEIENNEPITPALNAEIPNTDIQNEKMRTTDSNVPHVPRRRRPGGIRMQNRRKNFASARDRAAQSEETAAEVEEANVQITSDAFEGEEIIESQNSPTEEQQFPSHPSQGNRRRNRRPTISSEYESYKTGPETPASGPPPRRPVSIIRRRPSTPLSDKIEDFLKEDVKEVPLKEEDSPVIVQPITIPEQMIPNRRNPVVPLRSKLPSRVRPSANIDRESAFNPEQEQPLENQENEDHLLGSDSIQNPQVSTYEQMYGNDELQKASVGTQQDDSSSINQNSPPQYKDSPQVYDNSPQQFVNSPESSQYGSSFPQYDNSPSQYDNSPQQFDNSRLQYDNSPPQYDNSPPQYDNAPPQYDNSPPQYENPPPQYENPPPQYESSAPQYNNSPSPFKKIPAPYEQSPSRYEPAIPRVEAAQSTFQSSQNQRPQTQFANSPYQHSSFGSDQTVSASDSYYSGFPQAQQHYDVPKYSDQTYQHPSVNENIYEYANPDYEFRRTYPTYQQQYAAAQ